MREVTDLARIKEIAVTFLYLQPEPVKTGGMEFLVKHPYLETAFGCLQSTGKIFNVFLDKDIFRQWQAEMSEMIHELSSVYHIMGMVSKSYRLVFFKYINEYLGVADFTKTLKGIWVAAEFPSCNTDVSLSEIGSWFKVCDKDILMTDEEQGVLSSLPEKVRVYRGILSDDYIQGISWTLSRDKAEWFAGRFESSDSKPVVCSFEIDRQDITAYIAERGEYEVIILPEVLQRYKIDRKYL